VSVAGNDLDRGNGKTAAEAKIGRQNLTGTKCLEIMTSKKQVFRRFILLCVEAGCHKTFYGGI
jgi:hypothetical protein